MLAAVLLAGCTANLGRIQDPPRSLALTTPEHTRSMVYLARTDAGIVVIDLGWIGAERALREGLRRMGATPDDVAAVFLTHSHRDHVGGWRVVRNAPFHLAAGEEALLRGDARHSDLPSRIAAKVLGDAGPVGPDAIDVRTFSHDTAFVFGRDTLRAFPVPGHTAGSAAYLLRGVLFVGDALSYSPARGLRPASRVYSEDLARSRESVASLWTRVRSYRVEWVCTAHAKCAAYDPG